jgi:hypothetical protein
MTTTITFRNLDGDYFKIPLILDEEQTVYKCDGKQGEIYFNGYYYVNNSVEFKELDDDVEYNDSLPLTVEMRMRVHEKTSSTSIINKKGDLHRVYKLIDSKKCKIEIYKIVREKTTRESNVYRLCEETAVPDENIDESTDSELSSTYNTDAIETLPKKYIPIDDTEDEFGCGEICHFPTCNQTIYFRVIDGI